LTVLEPLDPRRHLADVTFSIDAAADLHPISRYIYGTNGTIAGYANPTFVRSGGNRMTGHNWELNTSNAGADWYHHSDFYLTNGQSNLPPGAAVRPMIEQAAANGRGAIVTVPMAGYVAADANGTVDETEIAPSPRWKQIVAKKSAIYPGQPLSTNPNKTDGYVFTDEFVHWVQSVRQPNQPIFFDLDNEPSLWGELLPPGWQSGNPNTNPPLQPSAGGRTHPTIHPFAPTFNEMRDKSIAHASAIKDVAPDALVFGGVGYGWNEFTTLQDAPGRVTTPAHPGGDQPGELHYYEWLLNEMRLAEAAQQRTLMDVLDLHWYPEARGGGVRIVFEGGSNDPNNAALIAARLQAPRSLWDPTYTETSWITQFSTLGPLALLPRVKRDINDFKPGTRIAITEYNYGGPNHISGGIAQADVLGIFGREGVFAGNEWPLAGSEPFIGGAFNMFRNYDGAGGAFGDTSIRATTTSVANTSVYASVDSTNPNVMTIVAINKTSGALSARVAIQSTLAASQASVYRLTSSSAAPQAAGTINITDPAGFDYAMPAYSVSTIRVDLRPAPAATSSSFDFETAPNTIRVAFNADVSASLSADDLIVTPQAGGAALPVTYAGYDAGTNTARFTLPTTPLDDGRWRATMPAAAVTDAAGRPLAADVVLDFFTLAGDANRDATVNLADFNILASNFGLSNRTFSQGDFNYDTLVNLADFNILAGQFGQFVSPTAAVYGDDEVDRQGDELDDAPSV
jgi:hypothetical protein